MAATDEAVARGGPATAVALPLFAGTLLLSAFLLFSVQPFFAKMVLPRLGGSPAVWSVAMVFFQSVLLLGYGYAHLLAARLPLRAAVAVHTLVLAAALFVLPIAIPAGWDQPPESGQAIWLLGLFAVAVGLPFFAVSASAPLLQAWFARTGHPHAADPYFLYGASNIGSFASLILFIVFFEPLFSVGTQSLMWTGGYVGLAGLIGLCASLVLRRRGDAAPLAAPTPAAAGATSAFERLRWTLAAFVPSGLLVAVTAHISVDVAAAPFLWVIPLALFLLTFVIVFRTRPLVATSVLSAIVPAAAALAIFSLFAHSLLPVWGNLAIHLGFFFVAALLCHSRLFEWRPPVARLTEFYLWMSFGGVLGGIFATLVAPVLFNWVAEYPLLIVAAMLFRPALGRYRRDELLTFAVIAAVASAALMAAGWVGLIHGSTTAAVMAIVTAGAAVLLQFFSQSVATMTMTLVIPLAFLSAMGADTLFHERTFFGVVRVADTHDGRFRKMTHGTTVHGAMALRDEAGSPIPGRPEPLTYYHESGGIASALSAMQARRGGAIENGGVVGLGTGTVLCHAAPGESWTAFEIDGSVVTAATDPALFSFISDCAPDLEIVLGDARLTLERQPAGRLDFLLIDAFSSDSIPVHLMTREAIRLYFSRMKQDGILAIHISNRYLELESVLAAIAREEGLAIRGGVFEGDDDRYVSRNHVVAMAREEWMLGGIATDPRWTVSKPGATEAWRDDFSNVFAALLRKL